MEFINCAFKNTKKKNNPTSSLIEGGFLHITSGSTVSIVNCTFQNGFAKSGGAIFMLGQTIVKIYGSAFSNNVALEKGGAVYGASIFELGIQGGSKFIGN